MKTLDQVLKALPAASCHLAASMATFAATVEGRCALEAWTGLYEAGKAEVSTNPDKGEVNVRCTTCSGHTIEVYASDGRVIHVRLGTDKSECFYGEARERLAMLGFIPSPLFQSPGEYWVENLV